MAVLPSIDLDAVLQEMNDGGAKALALGPGLPTDGSGRLHSGDNVVEEEDG